MQSTEIKALRDTINAVDQYGSPSGAYDQARFNAIDLLERLRAPQGKP